jgi:hypothetical protein
MATFSKKVMGKEVGDASVYAKPHHNPVVSGRPVPYGEKMVGARVSGPQPSTAGGVDIKNSGYNGGNRFTANDVNMSVGNISRDPYKEPKTTGIVTRGNGCATKGITARGPMA